MMVVRGGGWRLDFNKNSATTTTTSQQQLKNSLRILKTNIQYRIQINYILNSQFSSFAILFLSFTSQASSLKQ
jgi:hypothetical protein